MAEKANTREVAERIAFNIGLLRPQQVTLADAIDEALRNERERAVLHFMGAVQNAFTSSEIRRVDLYKFMLETGREIIGTDAIRNEEREG